MERFHHAARPTYRRTNRPWNSYFSGHFSNYDFRREQWCSLIIYVDNLFGKIDAFGQQHSFILYEYIFFFFPNISRSSSSPGSIDGKHFMLLGPCFGEISWRLQLNRIIGNTVRSLRLIKKKKPDYILAPPLQNGIPSDNIKIPPVDRFKDEIVF